MTNRDVAVLAFKLLGLWLMASALIGLASVPYLWDMAPGEVRLMTVAGSLLPSLVMLGIGIPIWFSADALATRTFPATSGDPLKLDRVRGTALLAAAMSVIGILLVAESLPMLVNGAALFAQSRTVTRTILGRDLEQERLIWDAAAKASVAAGLARLAIGLALIAGPARLSAGIASIRKDLHGTLDEEDASNDQATS